MKKTNQDTVILLDAHALIHRAYHALPEFASSDGTPTGALYGLSTMLIRLISEFDPTYIIACYDLPEKTFRHIAYEAYKGTRSKTDDALIDQLNSSRDVFDAFSIPQYSLPGFEADDMLGTITEQVKDNASLRTIIASGDMDTLQLVSGTKVTVYTLKKGLNDTILYDEKAVKDRFGFGPKLLPDYKGLRGDPSDNIIGIKGIGEKTASTLIQTFGSIESIYKAIHKDEKKVLEVVSPRILELLKQGEEEALFSKTLAEIRRDAPIVFTLPEKSWKETVNPNEVLTLFQKLEFKTLGNRFQSALGSSITQEVIEKEEIVVSDEYKKILPLMLWVLDSEQTNPSIEDVFEYTGAKNEKEALSILEEKLSQTNSMKLYETIELPLMPIIDQMSVQGICVDVPYLTTLSKTYHIELSKLEKSIWEYAGREFNINSPKQLGEILFDEMGLSVKGLKKSAGGARSTKVSELEKLQDAHPIIEKIMEYRELQKLLSTYIDVLPALVKEDGRIHAEFIQSGTTTGRFASQNPNLQNIPIKSELGRAIRNAFIAPKGTVLIASDYSQIELRVAAMLSKDEYLIDTFKSGKDIHTAVAMRVFQVKENDVTPEMRRRAKVINFGILYGMGVTALKQNLGTDRKEAEVFYQNYFNEFPTIAGYLESVKMFARKNGYTETLFGRRRYFKAIQSPLPFIRASAERMAINAPIQGTAADIMKLAIIAINKELEKASLLTNVRLVLQVHDEVIYEVDESVQEKAGEIIRNTMKSVLLGTQYESDVPLEASLKKGIHWGALE